MLHAKNWNFLAVSFGVAMYARAHEQLCVLQKYHNTLINLYTNQDASLKTQYVYSEDDFITIIVSTVNEERRDHTSYRTIPHFN